MQYIPRYLRVQWRIQISKIEGQLNLTIAPFEKYMAMRKSEWSFYPLKKNQR